MTTIDPAVFAPLDEAIRSATPEERGGLVVNLFARMTMLIAGLAVAPTGTERRPLTMVEQQREFFTYEEAAKWLDCSASYLETLVAQGKLRSAKLPATDKGGAVS
jgi:hypothetical protein